MRSCRRRLFAAKTVGKRRIASVFSSENKNCLPRSQTRPSALLALSTKRNEDSYTKTYDDVAFRFLSADEHPDHSTLAEFRKRHLQALAGLFTQALQLCAKAGLVKLGHVAIDGTKIKANASKHKAMSYGRMSETEQRLQQESRSSAEAGRGDRCCRGCAVWQGQARRRVARGVVAAREPVEKDPAGQGRVGKGSRGQGRAGTRRS